LSNSSKAHTCLPGGERVQATDVSGPLLLPSLADTWLRESPFIGRVCVCLQHKNTTRVGHVLVLLLDRFGASHSNDKIETFHL